jgi:protein gp37
VSAHTDIQWCDSTVNPTMGCDGCELWNARSKTCYAGVLHGRYGGTNSGFSPKFEILTQYPGRMAKAAAWSDLAGTKRADKPWLDGLPRLIFVSDMSDALSRAVPFDYLHREVVEEVTSPKGSRHCWLWLTKLPSRMLSFDAWLLERGVAWPANLWAGTSITRQPTAARWNFLKLVRAPVRFLSVEPVLEAIDLVGVLGGEVKPNLVISGGASGTDLVSGEPAAPCDVGWLRALRDQCAAAGVPYFCKQLGARPLGMKLKDSHGGDWSEWPADLRVRQVPHPPPPPQPLVGRGLFHF